MIRKSGVKIVGSGDNKSKDNALQQIRRLLRDINRYILYNKPQSSGIPIDFEMLLIKGVDVRMNQDEKTALKALQRLHFYEKKAYNIRHTLHGESAKLLADYLSNKINIAQIHICQVYLPRHHPQWLGSSSDSLNEYNEFLDGYYPLIKSTYTSLLAVLKDASESDPHLNKIQKV